jgi:hypothetical protein
MKKGTIGQWGGASTLPSLWGVCGHLCWNEFRTCEYQNPLKERSDIMTREEARVELEFDLEVLVLCYEFTTDSPSYTVVNATSA